MAIVPSGSPAWTRTVDHSHYGGHASKQNYLGRGAIDALTDLDAEEFSRMVADQAAAVRSAAFATLRFTCSDTSPAAPTIHAVLMMTGVRLTSYVGSSPPAGFPSAARNADGDVTFTFAASYSDEYGVSGAFAPVGALATAGTPGVTAHAQVSGSTIRVALTDDAGAAVADASCSLVVW